MIDEAAIAARLYGGGEPESKPDTAAPAPTEFDQLAARMYGKAPANANAEEKTLTSAADPASVAVDPAAILKDADQLNAAIKSTLPPEIAELRNNPESRLYGSTPQADILTEFQAMPGLPPEAAKAVATEWSRIAQDVGMEDADIKDTIARIGHLRAAPVAADVAIDQTIQALNREFGLGARAALRGAHELVARDPRVGKMLQETGLGNDAATVVRFAKLAQRQRSTGRLKGKS